MFCICTLTASGPSGSGFPHVGHDELTPPGAPPPERHPSQQHLQKVCPHPAVTGSTSTCTHKKENQRNRSLVSGTNA